ncbi:MAG: spore germination protein GerW family protein [Anaerolineae bacterium]|jgi:uncharacterized spore protein YtfJ
MSLNRLFETIENTRQAANWQAAFGQPQEIDGRTIIPVARVGYAYGLGFGQGSTPSEEEGEPASTGEGGGSGGGSTTTPLGAIVVTPARVYFEETVDASKIAIAGILLGAVAIYQVSKTLRVLFGK